MMPISIRNGSDRQTLPHLDAIHDDFDVLALVDDATELSTCSPTGPSQDLYALQREREFRPSPAINLHSNGRHGRC
jgi:hypothetical protein